MKDLGKKIEKRAYQMPESLGGQLGFMTGAKSSEAKEYWQKKLGEELSEIINQDGGEVSDGECIDQIIKYLLKNDIYVDRR